MSRPAVPSRIRLTRGSGVAEGGSAGVGEELAVDGVGDPSLEAPHGLEMGLAGGAFASVVGASFGVEADLGGGRDVQHVVDLAVPGAGEAVSDLLAGGGIQRCGAGPGGEPVAVGEPGHVADVGQDPAA
jgi:hypothetical protein